VTKEFEAQSNELTEGDFRQSILVVKALEGLLFFNSGPDSGSSQPHKHVQIFPKEALELPIIKKITEHVNSASKTYNY
jgi:ATP adenylyltransferase